MGKHYPEKYTVAEIVTCLADNTGITKKQAKEVYDSLIEIIKKGVATKHRVPLGDIGKVFAHTKPASKAREGRNPTTGQTIKIAAKPARSVPKASFSKTFKESIEKSVRA